MFGEGGFEKMPGENYFNSEGEQNEERKVPENWTILYHGTNLSRPEWQGEKRTQLDSDQLLLIQALSVISDEERKRSEDERQYLTTEGISARSFDSTTTYSEEVHNEVNEPLEIQVMFPLFHQRRRGLEEVKKKYEEKFGAQKTESIINLSDTVYWNNRQGGRHPLLPKGMILKKLGEIKRDDNKRVIQYVPEKLMDVYERLTK